MLEPNASESELRRRIANGSTDPDDYRHLAAILCDGGRWYEAVEVQARALDLPLTNLQRAKLLEEKGWILYEPARQWHSAHSLGQSAIALLSKETDCGEVLFLRALAYSLMAHCSYPSGEPIFSPLN